MNLILSMEKHHLVNPSHGHAPSYASYDVGHHSLSSAAAVSWNANRKDDTSVENGTSSNTFYQYGHQTNVTVHKDTQEVATHASTSSSIRPTDVPQDYASYTLQRGSSDPYECNNTTGYQGYYYGYQQPANHSFPQQMGTYQNTGANPCQTLNSFPNTGTYVPPPSSYSSTYYNTGDYQTPGGYPSSVGYNNQANLWSNGSYGNYHLQHNYSSVPPSSSTISSQLQYEQQYKQWVDYYSQNATVVSCAPGTENISVPSSGQCYIPSVSGGYSTPSSQPPPPGTTSWRHDVVSSEPLTLQAPPDTANSCWNPSVTQGPHNYQIGQSSTHFQKPLDSSPSSYLQKPLDSNPSYSPKPLDLTSSSYFQKSLESTTSSYFQKPLDSATSSYFQNSFDLTPSSYGLEDQQTAVCSQRPNSQFSAIKSLPQNFPSTSPKRISSMQIPTNPRIPSTLVFGLSKVEKGNSTTNAASKPAYISVSMPKSINKASIEVSDSMIKQGAFPASLRDYVERALARCKDDTEKIACQNVMKEMITKASADGTLFTRDWDTEPLFQIPNTLIEVNDNASLHSVFSPLPTFKRSPSKRNKSRWEPVSEEKLTDKMTINSDAVKDTSWEKLKERGQMISGVKSESWNSMKFSSSHQHNIPNKVAQRPVKKQRLSTENGDVSSDSDVDQGLTAYYAGAITLAKSPEEIKKRENRSKRFEKSHGQRPEIKHPKPKISGIGNLYSRTASLGKTFDYNSSRAVEDMDWDAFTVKGTCQEIEKRYLRLTSAPDPSTVRPEEVLERALNMVQGSQKNYLYKCDQLKSIRQDLTVQRIRNELTVKVYETHARLTLEAGDLPEYNQCQSQLKNLYSEGIKGCYMEFSAYNLLCVMMHSNNNRDLLSSLSRLPSEAKKDEAVQHALAVRSAVTSGNYILFFRLYKSAPNLNSCLMDLYVEKMRFEAVKCICKSYRPTVPIAFIAQSLGFSATESSENGIDGLKDCEEWLRAHGSKLVVDSSGELQLDTKATSSSLYMPEPEDAVSHGDASLAVNDFLTRTL